MIPEAYIAYLKKFPRKSILRRETNTKAAVIVETRDVPHLDLVVGNFQYFLGTEWNFYHLRPPLPNGIHSYNALLTDPVFWEQFHEEWVLLFQSDSLCLGPLDERFYDFDMVGAPCGENGMTFNGGVSLRWRTAMLYVLGHCRPEPGVPEDVFFTQVLRDMGAPLPDEEMATRFCFESGPLPSFTPFALHGIDKYHDDAIAAHFMDMAERYAFA